MAAVAEALLISSSAVSQQIALLEDEAGIPLVERRGRGIGLTVAGKQLAQRAERIMSEIEAAKTDLAVMKKQVIGDFRVAAFPSVAAALLPTTIARLQRLHPQLRVLFEELEPQDGLAALRAWQTDVALVDDLNVVAGELGANIEVVPLVEDVFHVLLPPSHKMAAEHSVTLKDLRHDKWAIDTLSPNYSDMLKVACRRAGFTPMVVAKCGGLEVTQALVRGGCAIAITPGLRTNQGFQGVCVKKLRPEIRRKISVAFRSGERKHPALTAFIGEIKMSAISLAKS